APVLGPRHWIPPHRDFLFLPITVPPSDLRRLVFPKAAVGQEPNQSPAPPAPDPFGLLNRFHQPQEFILSGQLQLLGKHPHPLDEPRRIVINRPRFHCDLQDQPQCRGGVVEAGRRRPPHEPRRPCQAIVLGNPPHIPLLQPRPGVDQRRHPLL